MSEEYVSYAADIGETNSGMMRLGRRERAFAEGVRQAVLIFLGVWEDYWGFRRSVVARRKRDRDR